MTPPSRLFAEDWLPRSSRLGDPLRHRNCSPGVAADQRHVRADRDSCGALAAVRPTLALTPSIASAADPDGQPLIDTLRGTVPFIVSGSLPLGSPAIRDVCQVSLLVPLLAMRRA